ncbi:MAG: YicC family protein [Clostridiales bacterium]|jgi:uncharacterized protein (TIGR00255 family)|nr:YicC family protein [Clostridiales bacterium]
MIRSMTGYGRGECTLHDRKFTVEIKSVNHRYNDITIKHPRVLNAFEDSLRKIIGREVFRGKTDVYINMETYSKDDIRVSVNMPLSDAYVKQIKSLCARYDMYPKALQIDTLLKYPDIFVVESNMYDEQARLEIWEALESALKMALNSFIEMRTAEGSALYADILVKRAAVSDLVGRIKTRAPFVAREYGEKLRQRIAEALNITALDEARLVTEITLMADRACIDEELTRLESHIAQLETILNNAEPNGRKLDFLVQEMNREVNTIGSKSNDLEISKLVVELKSEVEKIREQVQNIE